MKIITLSEKEFDEFSRNHKYKSLYQTSNYAKTMKIEGFDYHYLGFVNNSNELIGATLLIYKQIFFTYKYAYAPYGFLIDYTNHDLVEELTRKLKRLLIKQKFIYIKLNPLIHCAERKKDGKIISYNPEINDILEILKCNGYVHHGFNKYFENYNPRWTAISKLTSPNDKLYYMLSKQVRNKISKATRYGIDIYKGNHEDLELLYEFIKRKSNKPLNYYQTLLENYKDDAEIYLAYINPNKFVKYSQELYEKELSKNELCNQKLQEKSGKGKDITRVINQKMESDKKLSIYQTNLLKSTQIFQEHPEGIIVGGGIIIKYDKGINLTIEGFNKEYKDYQKV